MQTRSVDEADMPQSFYHKKRLMSIDYNAKMNILILFYTSSGNYKTVRQAAIKKNLAEIPEEKHSVKPRRSPACTMSIKAR